MITGMQHYSAILLWGGSLEDGTQGSAYVSQVREH